MSEARPAGGNSPTSVIVMGLLAVVAAVIAYYIYIQPVALDRSILGLKGFALVVKNHKDKDQRLDIRFNDQSFRAIDKKTGLRILPLYDPDIFKYEQFGDQETDDRQQVLRRIDRRAFEAKIKAIPTLVIMPKWRFGALRYERLHPDLLIDSIDMRLPYQTSASVGGPEIKRGAAQFETLELRRAEGQVVEGLSGDYDLSLYAAQTFAFSAIKLQRCTPVLKSSNLTVLARCIWRSSKAPKRTTFWLLSDPDILNNHGAGNGNNFEFATSLVRALAKGKPVVVDATTTVPRAPGTGEAAKGRDRSFSDLTRFFAYPFSLFWIALMGLCFFTLWHAWRRSGPVLDDANELERGASKTSAIDATVVLLRGAGGSQQNDPSLARRHVTQRMEHLAADLLGTHRRKGEEGEVQLLEVLGRRNAALAERLDTIRQQFTAGTGVPSGERLFATLNEFEKLIDEARHEFGRPATARR